MKKTAALILAAVSCVLLGGLVVYLATNKSNDKSSEQYTNWMASPGTHFTSYQQQNYPDLTYAAENAVQAVVNIEVTQQITVNNRNPFYDLFGIPQDDSSYKREVLGGGSGVIVSTDGYIVTNNHVVENASKLKVKLYDQRTFEATVVGTDPTSDVALIKIDANGLPALPFGNSDTLRLGEWVLAIGSPFDLPHTITAGIVSAKARNLGALDSRNGSNSYNVESFIQTDAVINSGNSGGALVNTSGELVGINTLIKASMSGTYMGYSFAIPSSIVQKVIVDLKEYGVVQRAVLGIVYTMVTDSFIEQFGKEYKLSEIGGAYVSGVDPSGAAHDAGIKEGDVITEIEGVKIESNTNISEIIGRYRPNDKINVSVKRDGKVKQFDVVLRNKAGKAELLTKDYVDVVQTLGGKFSDVSDQTKKSLKIDGGVLVTDIKNGGLLQKARVKERFIITAINDVKIKSVADLNKVTTEVTYIEGVYPNGQAASYSIIQ